MKPAPGRFIRVTAERDGKFWFLRAPELPGVFAQVRRLDQAEDAIREVAAGVLDVDPDSFEVDVIPAIEGELGRRVHELRLWRKPIAEMQRMMAAQTADAIRDLVDAGYSLRDAGELVGISFQRAAQITGQASPRRRSSERVGVSELVEALEEALRVTRAKLIEEQVAGIARSIEGGADVPATEAARVD